VVILLTGLDPRSSDRGNAFDGLTLVAYDGAGSKASVNCRWEASMPGAEQAGHEPLNDGCVIEVVEKDGLAK
jgi:hypothetical protein